MFKVDGCGTLNVVSKKISLIAIKYLDFFCLCVILIVL